MKLSKPIFLKIKFKALKMVKPRTKDEIQLMRKSGEISAWALKKALSAIKPGVNLLEIEKVVWDEIKKRGGEISFATVPGYKWATCLTVNDELVHGIPKDLTLKQGDLLSIDLGAMYQGWHTDCAWSVIVGGESSKFLKIGEEALWRAIDQAREGNTIGDISYEIQSRIEGAGYSVSKTLIGHGVGKELHEPPDVPGIGKKGMGLQLQNGMSLAIETIYAEKDAEVKLDQDGWTYRTKDGSLGGLFEMSVIVGQDQAEVLTDWRKV